MGRGWGVCGRSMGVGCGQVGICVCLNEAENRKDLNHLEKDKKHFNKTMVTLVMSETKNRKCASAKIIFIESYSCS